MARKFLVAIDLGTNELQNAVIQNLSTAQQPTGVAGRIYFDTSTHKLNVHDGTQWQPIAQGGAAASSITLSGDVSGSGSVDVLTGDIAVTTTVADDSHNHTTSTLTGIEEYVQDTAAASITNATHDGVSVSYNDAAGTLAFTNTDKGSTQNIFKTITDGSSSATADSNSDTFKLRGANGVTVAVTNDDPTHGDNALIGLSNVPNTSLEHSSITVTGGTGLGVTGSPVSLGGTLELSNTGVTSLSGTTDQIAVSGSTGAVTLSLPNAVVFPGTVTLNSDPSQALHAVTKQYVDGLVSGLDWHTAVNLLAVSNVALTGDTETLSIDSHSVLDSTDSGVYRILLKGQTDASENGIYTYTDNGTTYTLVRAADADTYQELVGAAVFVMEGTVYGSTSWIQSNHYLSSFSGQTWTQFSGSGTYLAGNGLQISGNTFSIDTTVTVDVNSIQTLTNKTLTSPVISNPSVSGLYLSDNNIVIEGTTDSFETTLTFTDPTADRTITFKDETGTVAFLADITSAINALSTTDIEEGTNLYYTDERAQDAIGGIVSGSNSLSVTYTDGTPSITFDTILATTSYLSKASGLAVDISSLETKLVTDSFTKKYSTNVGNASDTSFAVSHNLGSRDVQVQVFDNTTYDTVEVDVVRTSTSVVTVSFAAAPASNAYRVVVIG